MTMETEVKCPKNSFTYQNSELYLSDHAYQRMLERARCNCVEDVDAKVKEMLVSGYESILKRKHMPKEKVITFQDLCLHIKGNTITTVTYNTQFLMYGVA